MSHPARSNHRVRIIEFDLNYYGTIIEKAWEEADFVFRFIAEGEGTVDGRNV